MKMIVNYPFTVSKHGSYKRYNLHMLHVKEFIEHNWSRLIQNFKVEKDCEIILRPLPRRRTQGNHQSRRDSDRNIISHIIQLDISKSLRTVIYTLFHELTHAEQEEDGRLKHVYNYEHRKWDRLWHDKNYGYHGFGQTTKHLERYKNQPWEQEANEREIFELKEFEKEYGVLPDTPAIQIGV